MHLFRRSLGPGFWLGLALGLGGRLDLAAASASETKANHSFTLRWQEERDSTNRWRVELRGLERKALRQLQSATITKEAWTKLLRVVVEQGDLASELSLPSMLGEYRVDGKLVVFRPRYPLQPGVSYRAEARLRYLPDRPMDVSLTSAFQVPTNVLTPSAVVSAIYPTADELPENLLKFYVVFSAPMSGGHIYEHIHLLDEAGRPIELPFLEIDEELWDPAMTRLTLFIDPGRIKRGVTPLEQVGPALEAGRTYTLVIDADWRDARGATLKAAFRKSFRVGTPNRTPLDPARWTVRPPAAGTLQPLAVEFDRPLDWALARRLILVRSSSSAADESSEDGVVSMAEAERLWRFAPTRRWRPGRWEILVPSIIEDLAGNNIGKSFEVDLFEGVQRRVTNQISRLTFEVR